MVKKEILFVYDGSFEGLLCCIFQSYLSKCIPDKIQRENAVKKSLFPPTVIEVKSDEATAKRVFQKLNSTFGKEEINTIRKAFASEDEGRELLILIYVRGLLKYGKSYTQNFQNDTVLKINQILKSVHREIHRMHAFVRFKESSDGLYISTIEPDFDVIPFIGSHFKDRYADQPWLIFDLCRAYGIHYDLHKLHFVSLVKTEDENAPGVPLSFSQKEDAFSELWKAYFKATNIKERRNDKLHIKHVPKRYWKHLNEIDHLGRY